MDLNFIYVSDIYSFIYVIFIDVIFSMLEVFEDLHLKGVTQIYMFRGLTILRC